MFKSVWFSEVFGIFSVQFFQVCRDLRKMSVDLRWVVDGFQLFFGDLFIMMPVHTVFCEESVSVLPTKMVLSSFSYLKYAMGMRFVTLVLLPHMYTPCQ